MADIVSFKPKPPVEYTRHTHDNNGDLLPEDAPQPEGADYHLKNPCGCALCEATFEAVVPVGAGFPIQCPECKHHYGHFKWAHNPVKVWVCKCGCDTFYLAPDGAYCMKCMAAVKGWA